MLETRELYKVYKPKKGVAVTALNKVSLKFPEKGMVFLLGKSGSGKSTLLNLLGGLDKYDSGEIIIKGVSSKDFDQQHFDSYRNTSSVINYGNGIIRIDIYMDLRTKTSQCFIDCVIHDLIYEMMKSTAGGTSDIHSRPLTYGFQSFQHLNAAGRIICAFYFFF